MLFTESDDILKTWGIDPFKPFPIVSSGWWQTVASQYWPQAEDHARHSPHIVTLSDGDRVMLMEDRPESWKKGQRIILMLHGLAGSHLSKYMVRISQALVEEGYMVMRLNLRGCGPDLSLAKGIYHSGRSEDARDVLNYLRVQFPDSKVTQIGFSLGANITMKMAGEDGFDVSGNLDSVVAVSPPVDLSECAENLCKTRNLVFDQYFVLRLKKQIKKLSEHFEEIKQFQFPQFMRLTEFDEMYTAPRGGFQNAKDYYTRCSSGPVIQNIRLPGLLLHAADDPIIGLKGYQRLKLPKELDTIITRHGGHVGFIGREKSTRRWMDQLIVNWIRRFEGK